MSEPQAQGPRFGPAGHSESFKTLGFKKTENAPKYVHHFGLSAYEYQAGHGVRLNPATGTALAAGFSELGVAPSIHAPYYISLASAEAEKRQNSLDYLLKSAQAVDILGGNRVIFHLGGGGGMPRDEALGLAAQMLDEARALLDGEQLAHIHLCPETMGRKNQLGSLDEILALCRRDPRHIPCIDFGHLNAVTGGALKTRADFAAVAEAIAGALDDVRAKTFHVHFSKIEFTPAGEKRHLTFEDSVFGPPFEPFLELVADWKLAPVVICESAGTQAEDARAMMQFYEKYIKMEK
ncbi:TIM barrel protein [Ruminococcaceae bacterium OttesenSCG-928-D13]|nr:TIM barrel protein [Ruminococcaceae bacterium OttesenSCG-928-D13]